MGRFLPWLYGAVLLLEGLVLSVVYATLEVHASDPLSVWLATLGTASMVAMLIYSVARRSRLLRSWARLSYWLHLHIFLGVQGVIFVCFHSLPLFLRLPNAYLLNPGVLTLLACLTVFCSGIFGRYLYAQVPKTLGGQHMQIKEVEAELTELAAELPPDLTELWTTPQGATSVFGLIGADLARRAALRSLRHSDLPGPVRMAAERRLRLERAKAVASVAQRWFGWWIVLHRPIAAAMYFLTFIHVSLALMFSSMRYF